MNPQIQNALRSTNPFEELRAVVCSLQAAGQDQSTILQLFETAREQLRESGREAEEDIVLEVMDCVVGWCSPHMSLESKNK